MKNIQLINFVVCLLFLFLLSGCFNDGDGQLELKESMKELDELPKGKDWLADPNLFLNQTDDE